jgi:hypothetical protein
MQFTTLAVIIVASALPIAAQLTHPPQTVVLYYPGEAVTPSTGISLGYTINDAFASLQGLQQNVSISLTWPNGTRTSYQDFGSSHPSCHLGPAGIDYIKEAMNLTDLGKCARCSFLSRCVLTTADSYTATWNYTFGTSPDPSQANSSYCGPGPFSYQSFLINQTFAVQTDATSPVLPGARVTASFPSQPTGLVKSTSTQPASTGSESTPASQPTTSSGESFAFRVTYTHALSSLPLLAAVFALI